MLNPDYSDILSEFAAAGVEYLVVGAYAMAAHEVPRATGDIDLWVRPTPGNAARLLQALRSFGAPMGDLSEADFAEPRVVVQIGVAPTRIDLLTEVTGLTFEDAWHRHIDAAIDGITVPTLCLDDLVRTKLATDRPKDRRDARALQRRARPPG